MVGKFNIGCVRRAIGPYESLSKVAVLIRMGVVSLQYELANRVRKKLGARCFWNCGQVMTDQLDCICFCQHCHSYIKELPKVGK